MSDYTIRDFATALKGVAESLDAIATELKRCNTDVEIDRGHDWKRIICGMPMITGETCVAPGPPPESFRVADLLETVEALRDWTGDVRSRLRRFAPETRIDSEDWSPSNAEESD